jgi:hypothetical protein
MKKIQLTLFMMLLIFQGFAQSLQVKGKVSSSDGTGIPGVSVTERGTSNGSVTSADGNYTIKVSSGANSVLVFSSVGMTSKSETVRNRAIIDVTLEDNLKELSEVVVVG